MGQFSWDVRKWKVGQLSEDGGSKKPTDTLNLPTEVRHAPSTPPPHSFAPPRLRHELHRESSDVNQQRPLLRHRSLRGSTDPRLRVRRPRLPSPPPRAHRGSNQTPPIESRRVVAGPLPRPLRISPSPEHTPNTSEVSEILKALKSPTLALEFFNFCRSHIPNFRHDAFTYDRILLILSKSSLPDRIDKMKEIVDLMEKLRIVGNISTVNILIGAFSSVDGLDKCLELLKKWDLQLTCYTYKCLLQAYLRANDLNRAFQIYGRIRRKGLHFG